jgi:bifunctional DNA-binding transcriptional regulator/antitoxin component of YhaV-PrlF toxin-antitoxin module
MGYLSKVQLIQRANHTRQFYLICPAPLAEALELEKGEPIEWVVEDRQTLILKRPTKLSAKSRRSSDAR